MDRSPSETTDHVADGPESWQPAVAYGDLPPDDQRRFRRALRGGIPRDAADSLPTAIRHEGETYRTVVVVTECFFGRESRTVGGTTTLVGLGLVAAGLCRRWDAG